MITDILNRKWECKCVGCSVASGEITPPGGKIAETKNFVLHQDPEIPIKAFLIVAAKSHIKSLAELNEGEAKELFELVYRARIALKSIEDVKEVSIIQEERSAHFHLWLLPRYEWMDEKFENSLTSVRGIMSYARENLKTEKNIEDILGAVEKIKKLM